MNAAKLAMCKQSSMWSLISTYFMNIAFYVFLPHASLAYIIAHKKTEQLKKVLNRVETSIHDQREGHFGCRQNPLLEVYNSRLSFSRGNAQGSLNLKQLLYSFSPQQLLWVPIWFQHGLTPTSYKARFKAFPTSGGGSLWAVWFKCSQRTTGEPYALQIHAITIPHWLHGTIALLENKWEPLMTQGECYTSQFNIKLQYLETIESLWNHLHLHGATQGYTNNWFTFLLWNVG